ncbi:hypothetical protein Trydic_g14526 [Trypoxylus dichotomus]
MAGRGQKSAAEHILAGRRRTRNRARRPAKEATDTVVEHDSAGSVRRSRVFVCAPRLDDGFHAQSGDVLRWPTAANYAERRRSVCVTGVVL